MRAAGHEPGPKEPQRHSELLAGEAWSRTGGTGAGHTESAFMEPNISLQGTGIHWKMALKDGTQKITGERQMDGVSNYQEEICKVMSVRELVDRALEEKINNK